MAKWPFGKKPNNQLQPEIGRPEADHADANHTETDQPETERPQVQAKASPKAPPRAAPVGEPAPPGLTSGRKEASAHEARAATPPNVFQTEDDSPVSKLTPRERQVFRLLCEGAKLNGIAEALGIKFSTVNTHQKSIYKKLGVKTRAECIIRFRK